MPNRLMAKGYDIELIRDKNGQGRVHGYRFKFGKTTIKASELGVGRNLTASKIGNTFRKLHPAANTCCSWSKTFSFCFKRYHIGQQKYGIARWSVSYKQCCQT